MLRLVFARNHKGRTLHSSIINNSIRVRIEASRKRVIDILRTITFAKPPNIQQQGQFLKIYPSSEEEYHKIREILNLNGLKTSNEYTNQETEGLVIRNRMITNFVPDGYQPLKSMINPAHYECFNVLEPDENRLLFLNGGPKYVQRVYFMYKKDEILKMSPNIIQVRHVEGLTRTFFDELFKGLLFHQISAPLTTNGVWKFYVADREDYLLLLSQPYFFGNYSFD
ncbi:hypothetical protein RF11_01194 [Thelohanellus kitauei]|uniref:Uncharacterized protein n=1 Tax=Thelohanellus kitauei TaxID=669202 RepID=A0A0C2MZM3_THEKT|nr:hypothetical protein RF11_01194 [Thelohanellus kitauei]